MSVRLWTFWVAVCFCSTAPAADTLYRCKAYSGGQFWSRQHCQEREALVDRIVSVPSGMSWSEQVKLAEQGTQANAKAAARAERMAEADEKTVGQQARARGRLERRCTQLQQDIEHQDSLARRGGSGRKLERIANRKQDLQDRQRQAGC